MDETQIKYIHIDDEVSNCSVIYRYKDYSFIVFNDIYINIIKEEDVTNDTAYLSLGFVPFTHKIEW